MNHFWKQYTGFLIKLKKNQNVKIAENYYSFTQDIILENFVHRNVYRILMILGVKSQSQEKNICLMIYLIIKILQENENRRY